MPQVGAHSEPHDPTATPNFYDDADNTASSTSDAAIVIDDDAASVAAEPAALPPEVETEARDMGWVPLAEWRGPKAAWVDASKFVERGRTVLPIVNAQLARERTRANALQERVDRLEAEQNEQRTFREEQTQARTDVEETGLRAQRRMALEAGDYDSINAIDDKLLDLRVAKKIKATTPKPAPAVDEQMRREFGSFVADNTWMQDKELQVALGLEMQALRQLGIATKGREFLDTAAARVKRLYPDKFDAPRRRSALGEINGGSGSGGGSGRGYAQLRPDHKAQCDKMVSAKELTREQYLAACEPDAFVGA